MVEKISVQIALEGGAEVQRQLADIGEAGQKAFADISQSAEQVGGFKNLKPEEVTKKLEDMGVKGEEVTKILQAVSTAVKFERAVLGVEALEKGFAALGTAATAAGIALAGIGAAIVAGATALAGYIPAAAKTADALRSLSALSGEAMESVSALQIAFAKSGVPLEQFAKQFTDLEVRIQEAARTTADAIEQSSQRIEQAHHSERSAALNLEQAELNLRKVRGLPVDPLTQQRLKREQAEEAVEAARLALQRARHEAHVAEANDLQKIIALYQKMGAGAEVAFDPLTTQATKTQALLATLAQAGDNWKSVLADILKNASELERIQIGRALGLDPKIIEVLAQGSAALQAAQHAAEALGIALSDVDKLNLKEATNAWSEFHATVSAVLQKLAASLAPFSAQIAKIGTAIITSIAEGDPAAAEAALGQLLDRIGQFLNEKALPIGLVAGQTLANAILDGFKRALTPSDFSLTGIFDAILRDLAQFGAGLEKNWEILKNKLSGGLISPAGAAEAGAGGGADFGPLIAGAEVAAVRIKQIFADAFTPPADIDFSGIVTAAQTAIEQISQTFANIDIASVLTTQIDNLVAKFGELAAAAREAATAIGGTGAGAGAGGGGELPTLAGGGYLGGRGSGTSDSNLAWVSRGEHIMPARAVAQPGVLTFLEALRRSGGNLRGVLDGMSRFALGGLVPRPALAFAAGGPVGMSNVTINFPGLSPITGLRASSAVVDELHRAAALAQVRSGGRKPSRYS